VKHQQQPERPLSRPCSGLLVQLILYILTTYTNADWCASNTHPAFMRYHNGAHTRTIFKCMRHNKQLLAPTACPICLLAADC
jgi:hypothetical protein